jgi:predicted RNA binding protein YcfA (HicA-like mRNA interferase family)
MRFCQISFQKLALGVRLERFCIFFVPLRLCERSFQWFGTLGFEEARQKGSHVVLKMGEAGCVVPMHHELRTGTLHGILKQAGISREEFIQAMS